MGVHPFAEREQLFIGRSGRGGASGAPAHLLPGVIVLSGEALSQCGGGVLAHLAAAEGVLARQAEGVDHRGG